MENIQWRSDWSNSPQLFSIFVGIAVFNIVTALFQNFIVSIIGSLFFGFVIAKKVSYLKEKIILGGFLSCFTSFSGFIYFLYKISTEGDWINFILLFNFIIILNVITMYLGFFVSRKIT